MFLHKLFFRLLPKRKKLTDEITKIGGALDEKPDSRDFKSDLAGAISLPSSFSLIGKGLTPVENQGIYNSCVANAVTTAIETYSRNRGWPHHFELSRMHLWNEGRKYCDTYPDNKGMHTRHAWKVVQDKGVTIEKLFPYTDDSYNSDIGMAAQFFSRWHQPFHYYFIYADKEATIKQVLVEKQVPVVFAIGLPQSFMSPSKSYDFTYKPSLGENARFNHAMTVIGYDDDRDAFLIRNSWGLNWGWKGNLWVDKQWFLDNAYDITYPDD